MFYSPVYLSLHLSVAPGVRYMCFDYSCFLIPFLLSPEFLFVILSSVFLFPGVLQIPVSLVNCFPVDFYLLLFSLSVTPPPCSIQFTCVLVLVFYMFHVFLTSWLRPCFVYSLTLSLDLPSIWLFRYSDLCLYFDYGFCLAPIKSFFHFHSVHLGPSLSRHIHIRSRNCCWMRMTIEPSDGIVWQTVMLPWWI